MKKKMLTAVFCAVMAVAMCACKSNPVGANNPTEALVPTSTPGPTATPTAIEEAYTNLPISDYEDYVESTVLPEGYVGLEVKAVTEADVDQYVQEVLENNKVRQLKEGPLVMGDIAIIDYVGYVDGVAFEGGSDTGAELELGSGYFIEGFESGLVGAKKGDSVVLNLKFSDDYWAEDLAGKDVVFEVKINSAAEMVLADFTDDFVTELTGGDYTTVADFRSYALGYLSEQRKYNTVMDYLVDNAVFNKFNDVYVESAFALEKEYYALMYGFASVEEFETAFTPEASTVLWQMVENEIRRYEQERVVLYCVAKAENIAFDEDEYTSAVTEYAAENGLTVEALYEIQDEKSLRQSMLMEKTIEYLLDNIVEVQEETE